MICFWSQKKKACIWGAVLRHIPSKQRKAYPSVCRCIILACLPVPGVVPKVEEMRPSMYITHKFPSQCEANADHINLLVIYYLRIKGICHNYYSDSHTSDLILRQPGRVYIFWNQHSTQSATMAEQRHNIGKWLPQTKQPVSPVTTWDHLHALM